MTNDHDQGDLNEPIESRSDDYYDPGHDAEPVPEVVAGVPPDESYPPRKRKRGGVPPVPEAEPRRRRWPFFTLMGCLLTCCACCILPIGVVTIGSASLGAIFENSEVTETGSMTLDLETTDNLALDIDVPVGDVTIRPGADDAAITIDYTKHAYGWSQSDAQDELGKMTLTAEQDPDSGRVTIAAGQGDWLNNLLSHASQVDMVIAVPPLAYTAITIDSNVGDIDLEELETDALIIDVNVGKIDFSGTLNGTGPSELTTNVGNIRVRLPDDAQIDLDATTDVGKIAINGFAVDNVVRNDDPAGDRWQGYLGIEPGATRHRLSLTIDVGDINVNTIDSAINSGADPTP